MNANKLRVLIAMGTRPEIIKLAPVVWAAQECADVLPIVCHSGQHTDLAQPMLDYFEVKSDLQLNLMEDRPKLPTLVGKCITRFAEVIESHRPDVVVTQGDTATTSAISMACYLAGVPVTHVEAGLRTGDLSAPWPEEYNRRVATLSADLHCAPTTYARDKLLAEGVKSENITVCGNPVVDALKWTLDREPQDAAQDIKQVVVTAHRRENFGEPLEAICSAILELTNRFPDHQFVFVTHPNPNAGPVVRSILEGNSRIQLAPPMSYPNFISLLKDSRLIISDSGGIQEEAPTLGVPLLITRDCTERPEVVHAGAAMLVGTNQDLLVSTASRLLSEESSRGEMIAKENPFGEGDSGKKIIELIVERYGKAT